MMMTRCASPQHPPALCQPLACREDALPPDWKRPPGRPRKTWIQQVEEDHGCTIDSLCMVIGAGSLVVAVATALAGQAQQ